MSGEVPQPTQGEIEAELQIAVAALTQVCVSHILVDTKEEAQGALDRVTGGEDFGSVASELSQDPGSADNDGILPCGSAGDYVPEFRDAALVAPIGEAYDTLVESQFGFHVLFVTDRDDPEEDALPAEDEIVDNLTAVAVGAELEIWFRTAMTAADVTVDATYGIWQTTPEPGVVAPTE